jgi:hypothetical protein
MKKLKNFVLMTFVLTKLPKVSPSVKGLDESLSLLPQLVRLASQGLQLQLPLREDLPESIRELLQSLLAPDLGPMS